jgi:hypothetical protein
MELVDAWVTTLRPIQKGDFGFIMTAQGVMLAKGVFFRLLDEMNLTKIVLGLYSKSASRNGKHNAISESSCISSISYLALQTFQYNFAHQFCVVSDGTALFQTLQFARIPPSDFLCLADLKMKTTSSSPPIITLQKDEDKLKEASKLFKKCDNIKKIQFFLSDT